MKKLLIIILFILLPFLLISQSSPYVTAIPAEASITPTGAASYTIPIEVPPGTNDVQPQIAISYNSQSGFGALGEGWDISGLSAITRGTKNHHYDNTVPNPSIKFNNEDELYLDGQRLILLSGTHFEAGAVYGLEVENYSRVTIKTYNSQNYFELKALDGQTVEYGKNAVVGSSPTILAWKISKATDVSGNNIEYSYSSGGMYLRTITYAGGRNSIIFNYSENTVNPQKKYIQNFLVKQDLLLSSIYTTSEGDPKKQYTFTYTNDKRFSLITENVRGTDTGISWNYAKSTSIKWGEESSLQDVLVRTMFDGNIVNADNSWLNSGDFDGDGYPDLVQMWGGDEATNQQGYFYVYLKNSTLPIVRFTSSTNRHPNFIPKMICADLDLDGKDEIILMNSDVTGYFTVSVYSYNSTLNAMIKIDSVKVAYDQITNNAYGYNAVLSNQNGDIYPDLVIVPYGRRSSSGSYNKIQLKQYAGKSTGAGFNTPTTHEITLNDKKGVWTSPQIGDFNTDGKIDFFHIVDPSVSYSRNDVGNLSVIEALNWGVSSLFLKSGSNYIPKFENLYPIDVNNDGRTDVIFQNLRTYDNGLWSVLINKGIDSEPTVQVLTPPIDPAYSHPNHLSSDRQYPVFLDYNGDGYTDLVVADERFDGSGYVATDWCFYKNNRGTFELDTKFENSIRLSKMQPVVADINNDGVPDLVYADKGYYNYRAFTMPNVNRRNLVTKITNSLGQTDEFTYKNNDSYEKPTGGDIRTLNVPIILVDKHKQSNGETIQYTFEKAKYHKRKGFLGFEKIIAENLTSGFKTTSEFEVVYTYYFFNMALKSQKVQAKTGSNTWTDVTNTKYKNSDIYKTSWRYIPKVDTIVNTDHLTGLISTISKTYNTSTGVLIKEEKITGDFVEKTEYSNFIAKNGSLIAYLPQYRSVTYTKSGETNVQYVTNIVYDNLGRISQKTEFANKAQQVVTNYEYFPTGNIKKVVTNLPNLPTQTIEYQYDNLYRLPTKTFNSIGQYSEKTYNFKDGSLISEKGIDGLTTSYEYNIAGQLTKKTLPNNQQTTYSRASTSSYGAKYKVTETINMPALTTNIYYDSIGREVYKTETGANGDLLHDQKIYNSINQLIKEVLPHTLNDTAIAYVEYFYDNFGRTIEEKTFDGVFVNRTGYAYNGLTTTVTDLIDNLTISSKTLSTAGLVAVQSDRGGSITYEYFADKQPKSITTGGATTIFTYDQYGNKSSIDAPNAGRIICSYAPNGLLLSQYNDEDNTTEITYDTLLRKKLETITEASTGKVYTYENLYKSSGNGIGQIDSITYKENNVVKHTRKYQYNANHLLQSKTDKYENVNYTFTYTYDTIWRLKKETSPSGLVKENVYNAYGEVSEVKVNDSTFWTLNNQSANGEIKQFTLSNGVVTTKGRLANSLLSGINSVKNGNAIQNNTYQYDRKYNLLQRNDLKNNRNEAFTYDNLDRLTKIMLNDTLRVGLQYADNGNISSKNDVGTYLYTPGRPNAMSGINGAQQGVSNIQQDIAYNAFNKVTSVSQDSILNYTISYGIDKQRVKTICTQNGQTTTRHYFGSYERELVNGVPTTINYIYTPSGLAGIAKTTTTRPKSLSEPEPQTRGGGIGGIILPPVEIAFEITDFYYVHLDNMGSIQVITNTLGNIVNEWQYSAWGARTRIYGTTDITDRGYTLHEHIPILGLINMNGRIFDPVLARFLSPDPYVQAPDFTQSYNRYAYCFNNPFKYEDPDGEFILTFLINTIIGWARGDGFVGGLKNGAHAVGNSFKIIGGLFVTDPNKNFWGRVGEFFSRITYQLPQTMIGFAFSYFSNMVGQVDNVNYKYGATVLSGNYFGAGGAITMGSYINGSRSLKADPGNYLFQHEYGHYIQSQQVGPLYIPVYGVFSLISACLNDYGHDNLFIEQDANALAFKYFSKHVENFNKFDEEGNLISSKWYINAHPIFGHNHQEAFDMEYKHTNFWGSLFVSPAQILYRAFVLLLKTI